MHEYQTQLESLTPAQNLAAHWDQGPLLVLAGPGSGKTRVLTTRIARILHESPDSAFRVLALTFTNKAADEMQTRLVALVDDQVSRATVSTFHSFCMQMLQQHGSHIGIPSDFSIYSLDQDRREILRDALSRCDFRSDMSESSVGKTLQLIDKLKGSLIPPSDTARRFRDPELGERVARSYEEYEAELARLNALDFNSLIQRAYTLVTSFEGIALRYRKTFRYWLVDEFQDTNKAQYKFLRALAGDTFKNIFVVADDDQIIYQWNGANVQQLQNFQSDFGAEVVQLPTNWRCPPSIVTIANNLVRHNRMRSPAKLPLEAGKAAVSGTDPILMGRYETDRQEAEQTAVMIAQRAPGTRSETAVIARSKATLDLVHAALLALNVPASLAQRKDDFSSPQFCWLQAALKQCVRKQDRLNFNRLVECFNRWKGTSFQADSIAAVAEAAGSSLYDEFAALLRVSEDASIMRLGDSLAVLVSTPDSYLPFIARCIADLQLDSAEPDSDLDMDSRAWRALQRSIAAAYGKNLPLDQFLQHIALQSKEPPVPRDTVTLMTIHGSKGKEFDFVHLVGLAEEVLPSYYSVKAGDDSGEMEEERRNCFVAITRTKSQLVLTYAQRYRGYSKRPSRFLSEMGFMLQS